VMVSSDRSKMGSFSPSALLLVRVEVRTYQCGQLYFRGGSPIWRVVWTSVGILRGSLGRRDLGQSSRKVVSEVLERGLLTNPKSSPR
jgi:hypothetical protein